MTDVAALKALMARYRARELTKEEFEAEHAALLAGPEPPPTEPAVEAPPPAAEPAVLVLESWKPTMRVFADEHSLFSQTELNSLRSL